MSVTVRQTLVVVFLLLLIGMAAFALIGLLKDPTKNSAKSSREKGGRHRRKSGKRLSPESMDRVGEIYEVEDRGEGRRRRRYRKYKKEHRPRNPSLAEAGGLPPKRPEGEAPETRFN